MVGRAAVQKVTRIRLLKGSASGPILSVHVGSLLFNEALEVDLNKFLLPLVEFLVQHASKVDLEELALALQAHVDCVHGFR